MAEKPLTVIKLQKRDTMVPSLGKLANGKYTMSFPKDIKFEPNTFVLKGNPKKNEDDRPITYNRARMSVDKKAHFISDTFILKFFENEGAHKLGDNMKVTVSRNKEDQVELAVDWSSGTLHSIVDWQ